MTPPASPPRLRRPRLVSRRGWLLASLLAVGVCSLVACNMITGVNNLKRGRAANTEGNPDDVFPGGEDEDAGPGEDLCLAKDCLGGKCTDGQCEPVAIVTGQAGPVGIAVDANNVYWTTRGQADAATGSVSVAKLDGKDARPLVTGQPSAGFIVLDPDWVYLTDQGTEPTFADGRIQRVRKDGTNILRIYDNQKAPFGLAVQGEFVYWANALGGGLMRAKVDGTGSPTVLVPEAAAQPSHGVAVSGDSVFFTRTDYALAEPEGAILRINVDGGTASVLANKQVVPRAMAVDATRVYWTNEDEVGSIMSVPRDGSKPATVLAPEQDHPRGIALDQEYVYWVSAGPPGSQEGVVARVPKAGGAPELLADGQARPYSIVVDDKAVYWTNFGNGSVMRMAKPAKAAGDAGR